MNNLFENITKKLVDKIEYLSTQIQHYFDVNTLLNNFNLIENENESTEKKLQKEETYFDKLFELYSRSNLVIECENELKQFISVLQKLTDNFFNDFKEKRENISIQMNDLVIKMKQNEKCLKEKNFIEEYEKENYDDFICKTEKERKEFEQQKQKEIKEKEEKEEQMKEEEQERKESDEKEVERWKMIEELEKKQKEQMKEKEHQIKIDLFDNFLNENEIELLETQIGRKCYSIIFDLIYRHDALKQ